MAEASGVVVCLDESMGTQLAEALRRVRAPAARIMDFTDLGLRGVSDEVWLGKLRSEGVHAVITSDSRILSAPLRRDVWSASGLSLFVLEGRWGNRSLFETARGLFWYWPLVMAQAVAGPQGGAWRVSSDQTASGLKRLFPELA